MVSETERSELGTELDNVLILVLVEDGLGAPAQHCTAACSYTVLILVLVEDGLGVTKMP